MANRPSCVIITSEDTKEIVGIIFENCSSALIKELDIVILEYKMIIGNPKEKTIPANFPINRLFDLKESEIDNDFKIVIDWFENFLAKPHPHLGREGHICPYIQNAVKANSIWIANIDEVASPKQIEKFISDCIYFFRALPKTNPKDDLLNCLLIIFPANGGESVFELIDNIQSKLKPHFVKEGLMIGEFYKSNTKSGLHNSNFHPLQSPIPMLAIRNIVESDSVISYCKKRSS